MKRVLMYLMVVSALLLQSCHHYDFGKVDPSKEEIRTHAEEVLGVKISADQDWSMTSKKTVTIQVNPSLDNVAKVQILTEPPYGNEDSNVLIETEAKLGETITLTFDVDKNIERLFAACVSKEGRYYIKGFDPNQGTVSFTSKAKTRVLKVENLPDASTIKIAGSYQSFNAYRTTKANAGETGDIELWKNSGWENDRLWYLSDAQELELLQNIDDFDEYEILDVQAIIDGYLAKKKNQKPDNVEKVRNSEIFRSGNNYLICDGVNGVSLTPIHLNSTEAGMCDIYYYYFDPAKLEGKSEAEVVQFLKDLPKYKAVELSRTFNITGKSQRVFKMHEYPLVYFGDDYPEVGTVGKSYVFPKGYKIGFMLRKIKSGNGNGNSSYKTPANGCCYSDGRLNDEINLFPGHFGSAKFAPGDTRMAMFGANGKTYINIEDGADRDYADEIFEVSGIEDIEELDLKPSRAIFTYIFEDEILGDYDMNDVVIKAQRIDKTHVFYSIEAVGAHDELYLHNINGTVINSFTEIHQMFGTNNSTFINTTNATKRNFNPVKDLVEVPEAFSFTDTKYCPWIYNKTIDHKVLISNYGEDPHGLVIQYDFLYPYEKTRIIDAYPELEYWILNKTNDDWYKHPVENLIIKISGFE